MKNVKTDNNMLLKHESADDIPRISQLTSLDCVIPATLTNDVLERVVRFSGGKHHNADGKEY